MILSKVGSVSKWGNVYIVCIRGTRGCKQKMPFALKIQNPRNMKTKQCEPLHTNDLNNELFFLRMSNYFVSWNVCVNFPLTPKMFVIPKEKLVTTNPRARNYTMHDKNCELVGILSEWADRGDILQWTKNGISFDKGIQLIVQIMMSLFALNYIAGYHHNDLHEGNILISSLKAPTTFVYRVYYGGHPVDIRIHNCDFLAKLWDFSYANTKHIHQLPGFKDNKNIQWKSDADQILRIMGAKGTYKTISGVIRKLRQVHAHTRNFIDFFNRSMYFLAHQSRLITISRELQKYSSNCIVSVLKPLTTRQKNTLYKRRHKKSARKRLNALLSQVQFK